MTMLGPRLVVAGTSSGVGKTTVATGLMAAWKAAGKRVGAAKVGPDFIDPGYHALATGRPGRNLDAWMCGEGAVLPLAGRAGHGAEVLVIEGVMGLFDGAAEPGEGLNARLGFASAAHIAHRLQAPVVLVVDASALSASVAPVVHGFHSWAAGAGVRIGGVVLNQVGSDGHEALLREALAPVAVPVLGVIRRDDRLSWRDRHLGLVPVAERPDQVRAALNRLADACRDGLDLDGLWRLACSAPTLQAPEPALPAAVTAERPTRIAVAGGPAFTFTYTDNIEALEAAGAECVPFDPCHDTALPDDVDGLVVGGGFPEVYADALSANEPLRAVVKERVDAGLPTWAECGGLLWLADAVDDEPMCGVIPAAARMTDRLTLGYRRAATRVDTPLGPAGLSIRGHEFHYSTLEPAGDALTLASRFGSGNAGHATPTLLASYLHTHLGARPDLATAFVKACAAHR